MTTIEQPSSARLDDVRRLLLFPVLAGATLGIVDLLAMTHLPYPWANLANSSAIWAVGAFFLAAALRTDPVRAAVAGVVMMLVAVEAYYAFAAFLDLGTAHALWSSYARMWMVFGVCAGVVFGIAGSWLSSPLTGPLWWQRSAAAAAGAGVLVGEALQMLHTLRGGAGDVAGGMHRTAAVMVALGLVTLLTSARTPKVLALAVILTVPCALFFAAAFSAVGISF
ncbi:MAG TPA: DUF6518 family protein [Marmoricola sp.]|jgi:hypothetical protein|nr:DUF6518 family protein [Marmoricola sp.]